MNLLPLPYIFCLVLLASSVVSYKKINVAFFLDDSDDTLDEVAIKSSLNLINYYTATEYFVNPLIYKTNKNDIAAKREYNNLHNISKGAPQGIFRRVLDKGVAAIFGPQTPDTNEIIQSVALTFQIPQFQPFFNPKLATFSEIVRQDSDQVFSFNLFPTPHILSKAFATLVQDNDWKGFTIIYEDDEGLARLQEVLMLAQSRENPIRCRKLGPGPDHRAILKEIVASGAIRIVLDCRSEHLLDILGQAQEVKLFEEYHHYIVTALEAHTVDLAPRLGHVKSNISTLNIMDLEAINTVISNWELLIKDHILAKSVRVNTALLYDSLNLFITAFSELDKRENLIVRPLSCNSDANEVSSHGYSLANYIQTRSFNSSARGMLTGPLTGPMSLNSLGQRSTFKLQIMELSSQQQFRVTATWDSDNPNRVESTITQEDRVKEQYEQLKGKTFRVVSRLYAPYLSRRISPDGRFLTGNEAFEGYAMDLIDGICKILNCSYEFELVPDNQYGKYNPDTKEWNGLIRYLLDRRADLAVCDLSTTYERRKAVDFTNPFMTLGISILYSKVIKEPPELLAFTNPLSLDVWLYMATAYIVISAIIFLVARLNPHEWENPHPCNPSPEELENIWDLKNCFWLTLGSIMAQGCDILPKGISTRMVAGMWWFFSLIMTACYTANLAAFLTQERMGPTIQNAEQLAAQTKIKYGCVQGGATASFFKDTNISTYHKMWVQMEAADPTVFEKSNEDGVKRVLSSKGKYAFLMESSSIEYEVEKHCELVQVGNRLDTKGYGIALPTNAPYRTAMNQAILKMQEQGTLQKLKERWWKEKNKGEPCKRDETSSDAAATELGLPHVGGVFVVLAGGITVALMIAVFEFLWNVRKVAVSQHMTLNEAFTKELNFAMDIWSRQKAVNAAVISGTSPDVTGPTLENKTLTFANSLTRQIPGELDAGIRPK